MSKLIPVLEVMLGITWHSLSFNVWCQTKLYKKRKLWGQKSSKYTNRTWLSSLRSYPVVCCSSGLCQPDFEILPLQDAGRCRDQSCLEEDSTANLSPPAGTEPATRVSAMSLSSQTVKWFKRWLKKTLCLYFGKVQWQLESTVLGSF